MKLKDLFFDKFGTLRGVWWLLGALVSVVLMNLTVAPDFKRIWFASGEFSRNMTQEERAHVEGVKREFARGLPMGTILVFEDEKKRRRMAIVGPKDSRFESTVTLRYLSPAGGYLVHRKIDQLTEYWLYGIKKIVMPEDPDYGKIIVAHLFFDSVR